MASEKEMITIIQDLAKDSEDWGDPQNYDINIKVNKNGGPSGYYSVMPKQKKPLSASDLEIKQGIDLEDMKRRVTPPTPEQVEARVKAILAKKGLTTSTVQAETKVRPVVEDDNDDFEFPVVEGSAN